MCCEKFLVHRYIVQKLHDFNFYFFFRISTGALNRLIMRTHQHHLVHLITTTSKQLIVESPWSIHWNEIVDFNPSPIHRTSVCGSLTFSYDIYKLYQRFLCVTCHLGELSNNDGWTSRGRCSMQWNSNPFVNVPIMRLTWKVWIEYINLFSVAQNTSQYSRTPKWRIPFKTST